MQSLIHSQYSTVAVLKFESLTHWYQKRWCVLWRQPSPLLKSMHICRWRPGTCCGPYHISTEIYLLYIDSNTLIGTISNAFAKIPWKLSAAACQLERLGRMTVKRWLIMDHCSRYADEIKVLSWWRHQMETFSSLLALCEGNSPVSGEFPSQRLVTRSFDVFFDLRLNRRLSKQSGPWWFE